MSVFGNRRYLILLLVSLVTVFGISQTNIPSGGLDVLNSAGSAVIRFFDTGNALFTGIVTIEDDLVLPEKPALTSTPAAGYGYIYVEDTIPSTLKFVDDTGAEFTIGDSSPVVDSVNGQTGVVVVDADDIDDTSTTNKFVTSSDITNLGNLSGTNTGDQTITLSGDLGGSGTGSIAATIQAGAIDLLMLNVTGTASDNTFLSPDGIGGLEWEVPAGAGDVTYADPGTFTGAKTFSDATLLLAGLTSGTTTLKSDATAGTTTLTFPPITGIVATTTVPGGGTGAATFTDGGVVVGNGTGALQSTSAGTVGQVLTSNGAGSDPTFQTPTGGGDVTGPAISIDNAIPRFDSTTGKVIQESTVIISDAGNFSGVGTLNTHTIPGGTGTLALTSDLHAAVTKSGTPDYISLSGQDIVVAQVDVTTDITGTITDAQVSNTLTASLFEGSGSSTTAVDLATAEVAGDLPLANIAQIAESRIAGRAAGASTGDITALTPLQVRTMMQTPTAITSSSNAAAWNSDNGQTFSHTLSENTTVAASSGTEFDGQMVIFVVTQAAGGYTLAWNAEFVAADGTNGSITAVTAVSGNMSVYGFIRVEFLSQWHLVAYKELAP